MPKPSDPRSCDDEDVGDAMRTAHRRLEEAARDYGVSERDHDPLVPAILVILIMATLTMPAWWVALGNG